MKELRGDTYMTSTSRGVGDKANMRCYRTKEMGSSDFSGRPNLFLLKKIGFAPWPDIMLSQTIYYWPEIFLLTLASDSEVIR